MKAVTWSIWAVSFLAVLDAVTTLFGIGRGEFVELNPLLQNALEAHVGWFLLLKGGLTLLWAAVMIREKHRRWLAPVNAGLAGGYAFVVARSACLLWLI